MIFWALMYAGRSRSSEGAPSSAYRRVALSHDITPPLLDERPNPITTSNKVFSDPR